mgnify:CR=1 FL=1
MIPERSFQNKFFLSGRGSKPQIFRRAARARGDETSRFSYGFMRVSAAGAKLRKRTGFIKVVYGFWSAV